jgi:hypothetical protein
MLPLLSSNMSPVQLTFKFSAAVKPAVKRIALPVIHARIHSALEVLKWLRRQMVLTLSDTHQISSKYWHC